MKINKATLISGLVIMTTIVVAAWFFLQPKGSIAFELAPTDMSLSINGDKQAIKHSQTLSLKPGTYTFEFSRDEFSSETKTVTIKNNDKIAFAMALDPQTDTAKKILADTPGSAEIIGKYQTQQENELAALMPIQGSGFSIKACRSMKEPSSDKKAFCITTKNTTSERLGELEIRKLGYNPDRLEMMAGANNLMTVIASSTYKVEAYSTDTEEKPTLYITPVNVPYIPPTTPRNEQLESIRTESLNDLETLGYEHEDYEVIFSNVYLSRYNGTHVHTSDGSQNLD